MATTLTAPTIDVNSLLSGGLTTQQISQGALADTLLSGKTINDANSANFYNALNQVMPDWKKTIVGTQSDAVNKSAAMAAELMTGEVPQDVQDAINRSRAEQGLSRGVFGQAARFATAADIGKTSLDLKTAGANMYGSVVSPLAARLLESATKLMPSQIDLGSLFAKNLEIGSQSNSDKLKIGLDSAIKNAEFSWAQTLGNFNAAREDQQISEAQRIQQEQFNILHPQSRTKYFSTPRFSA